MNKKDHDQGLTRAEMEWFHSPKVRNEFRTDLQNRLLIFQKNRLPSETSREKQGGWNLLKRPIVEHLMPSGLAGRIIPLVIALALISGVVYAVSKYAGYIPGFGIVNQDSPLRVLSSVQTQTKEGIQLKIVSALVSQENTSIIYSLKGIPSDLYEGNDPLDPSPEKQRCSVGPKQGPRGGIRLVLPDGEILDALGSGSIGYGKENDYQKVIFFGKLPENVNSATFVMDCIEGALPGVAPENWSIPITLKENVEDLNTFPILKRVETNTQRDGQEAIVITELIPLEDKFIILGRYIPDNDDKSIIISDHRQTGIVSFMDANGHNLPYNIPGDLQFSSQEDTGQFAYLIDANRASFPITMQMDSVNYYCEGETTYTFQLNEFPADNKAHKVGKPLDIGSCKVNIDSIVNNGSNITLKFSLDNHKVTGVSVLDAHDPTSIRTTRIKSYGNSVNVQLSAANLIKNKQMDLIIDGVGLAPLEPLKAKIELKDYK